MNVDLEVSLNTKTNLDVSTPAVALLTLTDRGLAVIMDIMEGLPKSVRTQVFLHEKVPLPKVYPKDCQRFSHLQEIVPALWREVSVLVFVMASGIVVRQIASLLAGKDRDPAVLVLDEAGKFVIPLLSGHLGGANAWAGQIARQIGAIPVITTATDVRGMVAPDEYARRWGWKVEPVSHLPEVNSLLLRQNYLNVWTRQPLASGHPWLKDSHYRFLGEGEKERANVLVDAFPQPDIGKASLYLIPPVLSVGVGCRRGVEKEIILERIQEAIGLLGASPHAISGLCSIDLKADEAGLIEAAKYLKVPFRTFAAAELQAVNLENQLEPSNFVSEKIGVDGVCEAASLLGTRKGRLILPKTKGRGVTVAISIESFMW